MKNTNNTVSTQPRKVVINEDNSVNIEGSLAMYEAQLRAEVAHHSTARSKITALTDEIYASANGEKYMRLPSLKAQLLAKLIAGNGSRAVVDQAETDIATHLPRLVFSEKGAGKGTRRATAEEIALFDATGKHQPAVSSEAAAA